MNILLSMDNRNIISRVHYSFKPWHILLGWGAVKGELEGQAGSRDGELEAELTGKAGSGVGRTRGRGADLRANSRAWQGAVATANSRPNSLARWGAVKGRTRGRDSRARQAGANSRATSSGNRGQAERERRGGSEMWSQMRVRVGIFGGGREF
ncbi:uncharacterized protein A4U43_C06F12930 [Asparagus officinalis]|uniref:Uncharacterized protein n=1 Tax=Asparagus officinalis TaxID=4686 RepID=A0A5P1EMI9_ASPOF|nr:uncharacterized protein A4U43_C06F12930 [Asparagus officinalis]